MCATTTLTAMASPMLTTTAHGRCRWAANAMSDHDGDSCRDLTEDLDDDEDGIFDEYDLCPKADWMGLNEETTLNPTGVLMWTAMETVSWTKPITAQASPT